MPSSSRLQFFALAFLLLFSGCSTSLHQPQEASFHHHRATTVHGESFSLDAFHGQVLLVTNIALECGTTQQLHDLQALHERYSERGFSVVGFPSGEFTNEDTSEPQSLQAVCKSKYGVTFPVFSPLQLLGKEKHEISRFLTTHSEKELHGEVSFNFEKFLLDRRGKVRARFGPFTGALSSRIREEIEELLQEEAPSR
ncbi:glutathione peroxidase [bacterium]|nr:glutathione peroxidase [bacterium]